MGHETAGVDYSRIHRIDSPANRRLRRDIWPEGHDLGQQSFATLPYFDHLVTRLGMGPDMHVLDLGSGSGGPAIYMASTSGCRMTGLEVNEVGVEVARGLQADAALEDRVEFVLGDGMHMPFDDETFDIAISMNVLNVFEDKVALFREVRRVLRPGGTWAFLSGTFDFVEGDPQDEAWRALYSRGYAIPQFTDDLASYKVKLRAAGFASMRRRSTSATSATPSSAGVTDGPSTAMLSPRNRGSGRPTITSSTSTGTWRWSRRGRRPIT